MQQYANDFSLKTDLDCYSQEFSEDLSKSEQELSSQCPTEIVPSQEDELPVEKKIENSESKSEMFYEGQVFEQTKVKLYVFFCGTP